MKSTQVGVLLPTLLGVALGTAAFQSIAQNPPPPPGKRPAVRHQGPQLQSAPMGSQGFGTALPGLNRAQFADFNAGLEEFLRAETIEGGLGPIFNDVSCVACHSAPTPGGASDRRVTRFGSTATGSFDPLESLGGSLLQAMAIDRAVQERVPQQADVVIRRESTPLYGMGLMEAIPDAALRQAAARPKPDGVRGRAAEVVDVTTGQKRVGRFGWKAQQATLLAFAGDAYLNEMGVTSRFFPHENAPNGNEALLARFDEVADPEDEVDPVTGKGDIDVVADFMRLLAPPPMLQMNPTARQGELLFQQVGCAVCHTPVLTTGPSSIQALNQKPAWLYSDLLLHDMGSLGDGIVQAAAGPTEMRTAPLWGLRASAPYLHDGRAATVEQAIVIHEGEGRASRDRYLRLTPSQRRQLAEFLNTL
jgi:CxxC motif-containing protein (DUF1111 family)